MLPSSLAEPARGDMAALTGTPALRRSWPASAADEPEPGGGPDNPGRRSLSRHGTGASRRAVGSSSPMTLKQLCYFLTVLRAGSVTGASGILHVAQPAIGAQIRALEGELGVRLFLRHSRGVTPTEAGEILARHAERLLAEAERMRRDLMEMGKEPRGRIALGLTATAAQTFGARLVRACHGKYPDLDLTVMEAAGHRLTAWPGELDMAVTCEPPVNTVSEALATEPLYFVAPPDHPLAEGPDIALRAVLDADLVLPPRSSVVHGLLADAARANGAALRIACTVESVTMTKDLVRGGFGCSVMPYGAIHREVEDGRLAALRIPDPPLTRTLYLTCAQDRSGSKAVEAVCGEIRALVAELVASGMAGWASCASPAGPAPRELR